MTNITFKPVTAEELQLSILKEGLLTDNYSVDGLEILSYQDYFSEIAAFNHPLAIPVGLTTFEDIRSYYFMRESEIKGEERSPFYKFY